MAVRTSTVCAVLWPVAVSEDKNIRKSVQCPAAGLEED